MNERIEKKEDRALVIVEDILRETGDSEVREECSDFLNEARGNVDWRKDPDTTCHLLDILMDHMERDERNVIPNDNWAEKQRKDRIKK